MHYDSPRENRMRRLIPLLLSSFLVAPAFCQSIQLPFCSGETFAQIKERAQKGDAKGRSSLGMCMIRGPQEQRNIEEGLKLMKQAADSGDSMSMMNLSGIYLHPPDGMEKNPSEGVRLLEKSAQNGFLPARTNLGFAYMMGRDVQKDPTRAEMLWHQAADAGEVMAELNLASGYLHGYLPMNLELA